MMTPEQFFRALSDATRLHCLLLLLAEGRLCVCEFVHALELSQPRVSRHLGQLRDLGIVQDERQGQWVHYRLHPALASWQLQVLEAACQADTLAHGQTDGLAGSRQRLSAMPNRPDAICN